MAILFVLLFILTCFAFVMICSWDTPEGQAALKEIWANRPGAPSEAEAEAEAPAEAPAPAPAKAPAPAPAEAPAPAPAPVDVGSFRKKAPVETAVEEEFLESSEDPVLQAALNDLAVQTARAGQAQEPGHLDYPAPAPEPAPEPAPAPETEPEPAPETEPEPAPSVTELLGARPYVPTGPAQVIDVPEGCEDLPSLLESQPPLDDPLFLDTMEEEGCEPEPAPELTAYSLLLGTFESMTREELKFWLEGQMILSRDLPKGWKHKRKGYIVNLCMDVQRKLYGIDP
jgi:hypothetical protein